MKEPGLSRSTSPKVTLAVHRLADHLALTTANDVTFWQAKLGVALQKNLELDAYYSFAADVKGMDEDPKDAWGVELNYAF